MKKNLLAVLVALTLVILSLTTALADGLTIAVPNDTTNEARALLLLEANGVIKLKEGVGIEATVADIVENPLGIEFYEVEAQIVPNVLADVDYAIINNNYALDAGLDPVNGSLITESPVDNPYNNILVVKTGNENTPAAKALTAALLSQQVVDFINETYGGAVLSVVDEPTDGYDADVDYDALAAEGTISVAATAVPHAEILEIVKEILAAKNVTLDIQVFTDYVQPNNVVDEGEVFANYFQHVPYFENFNLENGTELTNVASIHLEPIGLYGGKQTTLDALTVE